LPAEPEHPADDYTLRPDRCVVEVSLRLLGVRLVRARLRVRSGELMVAGSPPAASLKAELLARPERIAPPVFARRGVPSRRRLSFAATDVGLPTGSHRANADGEVAVHGSVDTPWSLPLTVRVVPSDDTSILLAVHGRIRPPGTAKGWFASVGRFLWLDAAAEFVR
jgi:hypothetical protein